MSIHRAMDKEDAVYMQCYSAIRKEWNNVICSNMDRAGDDHTEWILNEVRQTEKDKYMVLLISGI